MPERTKEEISDEVNEILGTSIDFTKLNKEELITLLEAIIRLKQASEFPLPLLERPLGEILDTEIFNKPLRETSLAEILGINELLNKRKGLFKFGILSRFMKTRKPSAGVKENGEKPT